MKKPQMLVLWFKYNDAWKAKTVDLKERVSGWEETDRKESKYLQERMDEEIIDAGVVVQRW